METIKKPINETLRLSEELDKKITEYLKPLPSLQPPKPPVTDLTIPLHKEFSDFYSDYVMYKTPITGEISSNILIIKNETPNAKHLQIGLYAIVELLADKFNQPVSQFYKNGAIASPLPDFDNIHQQLQKTMYWIETCFSNLLSHSDPRVIQMCKDYHNQMSVPLILRLRFYEFEKSIISVKINNAIQDGLKENNEKVKQFEKEYTDKLEKAKISFKTQNDESRKLVEKYKWIAKDLQEDLESTQAKLSSIKDESSLTMQKLADAETKIEELDRLYSDTKIKHDKIEKELKRFTDQPWAMGSNSTINAPTFINTDTGEVIIYPPLDEFKNEWKMIGKKDNYYTYEKGTSKFQVPEVLEPKFKDLVKELFTEDDEPASKHKHKYPAKSPSKSIEKKLAKNDQKILDIITNSADGLTHTEIAELAMISPKHVSKHLNKLIDFGLIQSREVEVNGRKTPKYITTK